MKLIICEKGTLGKNVAKAIGIEDVKEGYYICKNNYIVTWASGHIFSLYDIDDYLGEKNLGEILHYLLFLKYLNISLQKLKTLK